MTTFKIFVDFIGKYYKKVHDEIAGDYFGVDTEVFKNWIKRGLPKKSPYGPEIVCNLLLTPPEDVLKIYGTSDNVIAKFLEYIKAQGYPMQNANQIMNHIEFKSFINDFLLFSFNEEIKKTDSLFAESLSVLFNASYPDKTGTNNGNNKVIVTRYTLFALVKYFFPDEDDVLLILGDGQKSPEQITRDFSSAKVKSNELASFKSRVYFEWEIGKNGRKSGLIIAHLKDTSSKNLTTQNYRHALDIILTSYNNLPIEFHNNYSSLLKKEINITVSLLVLSAAYKNLFCSTEDSRSELLTICDNLISTHNHHNSFLYSLFERNRTLDNQEGNYLFREFSSESLECLKAVDLLKKFFYDNWVTEQKPSYVGNKFLLWANDKKVVYDIINSGYCYDYKILSGYAKHFNDLFSLRQIVRTRIFKTVNFWNSNEESISYRNHVLSFVQMASTSNIGLLLYAKDDPKYNSEAKIFLKFIIENLDKFPKNKWKMVEHGVCKLLPSINGYDPKKKHKESKQLLSEVDVDWSKSCFEKLSFYNKTLNGEELRPTLVDESLDFVKSFNNFSKQEKSDSKYLKKACGCLKSLFNNNSIVFDDDLKKSVIEIITILLNSNIPKAYETVLATCKRLYIFPESLAKMINTYAITFLCECDYAQQENNIIKNALSILKYNSYENSYDALKKCYLNVNKIKKNKPFDLFNYILEGLSSDCLIQKIIEEKDLSAKPFGNIACWLVSDKRNRVILDDLIYINDLIFEFVDKLIELSNKNLVAKDVAQSIIHFAKNHDCFLEKSYSSDCFYEEKLLTPKPEAINIDFIHKKSKEHELSINVLVYHLCKILKNNPEKTSFVCIEFLSKLYGQVEHMHNNSSNYDLHTLALLGKRLKLFPVLVSNPVIRNTAKLYCLKMRRFAKSIPSKKILDIILDIANSDKYPEWFTNIETNRIDCVTTEDIFISKLNCRKKSLSANNDLKKEIKENLIPWLDSANLATETYLPKSFILAIKTENDKYQVVDGNRVINHFVEESLAYGDFKINIHIVSW